MLFTCVACANEARNPRRFRIGLVCQACAAFLRRSEETFEPEAVERELERRQLRVVA